jgi:phosphate transport system substrate-binding protein
MSDKERISLKDHHTRRAPAVLLALVATLGLSGCGDSPQDAAAKAISAVGSSTVYPFAKKVAEDFVAANEGIAAPKIDSTGTADGIAAFCTGVGANTPDIVNASRRMTRAEFAECAANGVSEIIEIEVGLDGIVFASATDRGIDIKLTRDNVYRAIAQKPFGREQTTKTWADVDPALPATPILVYGPPESSGTREALLNLVVEPGCRQNSAMASFEKSDPERFQRACHALRSDSAFSAQGEQDDLIVRRVASNPEAIAIVGYSYLAKNASAVKPLALDGVLPSPATIADGSYETSRPLYIYVKKANLPVTPGLDKYLAQWAQSWGADGPLAKIGLVPLAADRQARAAAAIKDQTVLTATALDSKP